MTSATLPSDVVSLWWVTLAVGLVVAVVVVVLLHLLLKAVKKVESNVIELWRTATTVARNTATTWMLNDTGKALQQVKEEAVKHDQLLSKVTRS